MANLLSIMALLHNFNRHIIIRLSTCEHAQNTIVPSDVMSDEHY